MLPKLIRSLVLATGLIASSSHAALLGLTPNEPTIDFGGSGVISFDSATGLVTISGDPATLFRSEPFLFGEIQGTGANNQKSVTIQFHVDANGQVASGIDGPDMVVKGAVDTDFDGVVDYEGVLLEAEVSQFGFQDGGATDDRFDLRLNQVSGVLVPLYGDNDIAITIVSEISSEFPNPFDGSASDFSALAKGVIGTIAAQPTACHLDVQATCSVAGSANKSMCKISTNNAVKFWKDKLVNFKNNSCHKTKYGMHGGKQQWWSRYTPTTDVKFTYVLTNTGATPVTNIVLDDSFDTAASHVPTTLSPGQSVTITRTEKLSEGLDNTVTVMGVNGAASCGANDVVVIKDKSYRPHHPKYDDDKDEHEHDEHNAHHDANKCNDVNHEHHKSHDKNKCGKRDHAHYRYFKPHVWGSLWHSRFQH